MVDGLFPPFAEPSGRPVEDGAVLQAFATGGPVDVYSPRFHIEGQTLLVHRDVAVGQRIGPGTVLVRADLPDSVADAKPQVEQALTEAGLSLLDEETPLGVAIALQLLGLRLSTWDLWGTDIDEAFAALRAGAVGDDESTAFSRIDPPPSPW